MKVEIISYTLADAKLAAAGGADRLELITAPVEGGLTPSAGLVQAVREATDLELRVMIRPHSRHFHYDEDDLTTMEQEIAAFRHLGIDGYVLGLLTPERAIDTLGLERLLHAAEGLPVTFHRAFDEADQLDTALLTISRYPQITHILTSGGQASVLEAADTIKSLQSLSRQVKGPILLPGAGLNADSLEAFLSDTQVSEFHMGSGVRNHGQILEPIDPLLLKRVRAISDRFLEHNL